MRAFLFLAVVLAILAGAEAYMAMRSMALWPFLGRHPAYVAAFFAGFILLLVGTLRLQWSPLGRHAWLRPLYWPFFLTFGFLSTFLVALVVADLGQGAARSLGAPARIGGWAFAVALGGSILATALGLLQALRPPALRQVEVPLEDLPQPFEGFRIVQLSDLHLGPLTSRRAVDRLAMRVRALGADLIVVTGDLVDGEVDGYRDLAQRLADLGAVHGTCFVTGNHEYFHGAGPWQELLRSMGWRILENEHWVLSRQGAQIVIAGLPDPAGPVQPDLAKALAGAPPGPAILLFHRPSGVESAERAGIALQLSGHTHGGQYFPWNLLIGRMWAFPKGLGRFGRMWIYTSPGTGVWGPPNRFMVPTELTLLVLRPTVGLIAR